MDSDKIRRLLLDALKDTEGVFARDLILEKVAIACNDMGASNREILDAWDELFRLGVISTGMGILVRSVDERNHRNHDLYARESDSNPHARVSRYPWAHLTALGTKVVAELSRDPVNREGYVAHLSKVLAPNSIAMSYATEAVSTFNHNCPTATAVLVGAAAEAMLFDLRDATAKHLAVTGDPGGAKALRKVELIKHVIDALTKVFDGAIDKSHRLREKYEAYWSGLAHRGRMLRNDAGHPKKLDPISRDEARTMLILFLSLAELVFELEKVVAVP